MSSIHLRWTRPHLVVLLLLLVLTACGGSNSSAPPEITLAAASSDVTVVQGRQVSLDLSVARVNGAVPVQLVTQGLPSGVSLVFSKNPVEDKTTATLKVGVNVTPATYPFQVVGTAGSVSRAIDLQLKVLQSADVTPPSVRLTVTPPGVTTSQTITLSATVQDDRGIARVEFFQNGVSLGTVAKAPWTLTRDITPEDNGAPLFSARATDTAGNTADSEPVMISVLIDKSDPVVTIDADTGTAISGATYRLSGAARDDIGVKLLTYTLNGGPPVPLALTGDFYAENLTLHEGENRITVVARDAGGHTGSASRTVTYTPPDTTPPTLSVTSDHPGTITAPTQVTLTADAHDNRAVQRVLFFQNGLYLDTLVKTADTAPYRYTVDAFSLSNGSHTFTAIAEDSSGLRTSASVDVIVDIERTPPEVNITSRLYILDGAYTLTGTVTDASGVAHVRLRNQSTQTDLGEVKLTEDAFSVPLTVPVGLTSFTLYAIDQMGNVNPYDFSIQNIGPDITSPSPVDLWASENDVRYAGHIALAAQASDDRQLGRLELLRDGVVAERWDVPSNAVCTSDPNGVQTCSTPPGSQLEQHTFFPSITSVDNGLHTFTVRATDVAGNVKDSAAQTLNINIGAANPARPITEVPNGRIYRWPGYRNVLWHFYAPVTYAVVSIGSAPVDALGNFSFPLPAAGSLTPVLSNFNFGPECTLLPTVSDPLARFAQAHLDAEYPGSLGHVILVGRSPDNLIRSGAYFYADRVVKLSGTADCVRDGFHTIFHYDLPLQAGWNLIVSDVMVDGRAAKPYETRVSLGTLDGLYWSY